MIIRRYAHFIGMLFVLFLIFGQQTQIWAQAPQEEKDPIKILKNDIAVYLLTSRILKPYESEELAALLSELENKTQDLEILRTVSLGVTDKVVKDRGNMHFLLADVEKLSKDRYSSAIAKIDGSYFESCWDDIKKLSADMKEQRPEIDKPQSPLSVSDYILIMNKNAVFLIGQGDVTQINDVWNGIKSKLDAVYPLWNKHYHQLFAKVDDDLDPEDVLMDEELVFLKIFGRVDWYYHRLTGTLGQ